VDVWWGSYAFRAVLPIFLGWLVLTALIAWGSWLLVPQGWKRLAFLGLGSVLWGALAIRFFQRFFGFNYRLTTHRLFVDRGVLRPGTIRVALEDISHVSVQQFGLNNLTRLGRIQIVREDKNQVVLEGVREPAKVVELIRSWVQKARERKKV
jgi:hypothetical protein